MRVTATVALTLLLSSIAFAQQLTRDQWGAMPVTVTHAGDNWTIQGKRNKVSLSESNLGFTLQNGSAKWIVSPSRPGDLIAVMDREQISLQISNSDKKIETYDAGFKTGVKVSLSGWTHKGAAVDLKLFLTVALEGPDEEVVFGVSANEGRATLRQLDWPGPLDARDVDCTLLSNGRGTLLPRNWSKEYHPIRTITAEGKIAPSDHSLLQSHVIESWSMSWWGFQKGKSGLMVIVETPDDAAYQFSHPAGGPTVLGPRWRAQLSRFNYVRSLRICLIDGNYVDMAKRYRRYSMDSGLFVSLKEKIARTPALNELIGVPHTRAGILRNLKQDSDRFDQKEASKNYSLVTFDERARQLRELKRKGFERVLVLVSGWPHLGYDRQHPDPLPPPEQAGGWEGMKRLVDTCREIGYPVILHDQYRDFYFDAPSYDEQFAVHEDDDTIPAQQFPGSRFGDSKRGALPLMRHWDGGTQAYLNARFQLGHLLKNYKLLFDHQIKTQGIYIDVIGYVPPDQDFNPEHPTSHTEAMQGQIAMMNWARRNLGIVATEAGSDWVLPYADIVNSSGGGSKAILVPLYNLVYHDSVIVSFGVRDEKTLLQALLFGGVPEMPVNQSDLSERTLLLVRQTLLLHKRVALLEMTNHEFLDDSFKRERTTFADGTTVTVDWNVNTYKIEPELK